MRSPSRGRLVVPPVMNNRRAGGPRILNHGPSSCRHRTQIAGGALAVKIQQTLGGLPLSLSEKLCAILVGHNSSTHSPTSK